MNASCSPTYPEPRHGRPAQRDHLRQLAALDRCGYTFIGGKRCPARREAGADLTSRKRWLLGVEVLALRALARVHLDIGVPTSLAEALREAHRLYEEMGAPLQVERIAKELGW